MSAARNRPASAEASPTGRSEARTGEGAAAGDQPGQQLLALKELREIGMTIARGLSDQATGQGSEKQDAAFAGADLALAFSRVARSIRQIIALERELTGEREAQAGRVQAWRKAAERRSVRIAVRSSVKAGLPELERDEVDGLVEDLFADYDDYAIGSPAEIVTRLCNELGVEPDLSLWNETTQAANDVARPSDAGDSAVGPPSVGTGVVGRRGGHDPP